MKILITGFRRTSSEKLLCCFKGNDLYDTLVIENDEKKCAAQIERALKRGYDYVFCLGQRPNIKDKVHIETRAKCGDDILKTEFDCTKLAALFGENNATAKLSDNAGTSFCNLLYYSGLSCIARNGLKTRLVFIHVPFMTNISDFDDFEKGLKAMIDMYVRVKNDI